MRPPRVDRAALPQDRAAVRIGRSRSVDPREPVRQDRPGPWPSETGARPARLSRTGAVFALTGGAALALPFAQFKPNRIVAGDAIGWAGALVQPVGSALAAALALLLAAGLWARLGHRLRLALAAAGLFAVVLALGAAAHHLTPPGDRIARVAPAAGFWLMLLALGLMATDALARIRLTLGARALLLAAAVAGSWAVLASGWLDGVSVMREYGSRRALFQHEAVRHLWLALGSLGLALAAGLPLGLAIHGRERWRRPVLGALNVVQTIPSLALFGIMIPVLGWVAAHVPGAASAGIAGIGTFPALVALFLYSLLPVVSNTVTGLAGVAPETREAAHGTGMTDRQVALEILLPLALPLILAGVRIVLVQNIGLAVIAGLIGGGGFGTFVFQGLAQTATDLVLLGALPTIALALVAGLSLDLAVEALDRTRRAR
ncbi:ABC transporter permease [Paracoccus yeei]|uniref:ABC transporter permease n=1 Tax=Paracoccus yeei TaxID=147645 RepID=UPI0028970DC7|nr:ABC transporter permease [Paracoccus yeei]